MKNHLLKNPFDSFVRLVFLSIFFLVASNASAENRHALVIGNSEYGSGHELINPKNDALAIADKLRTIGYTVHTGQALLDLELEEFHSALNKFLGAVQDGDSVLVYYAGHGTASLGTNFLIPILPDGVKLRSESDIRNHSVSIEGILERVEFKNPNGVNVFFFDACRDAPIENFSRSINMTGLTELDSRRQPHGSFIGFSTEYGSIATDGVADGHSPFAEAMLNNLDSRAGLPIELFYKSVGDDVFSATSGKQFPIQEPKIRGEFCIGPCLSVTALTERSTVVDQEPVIQPEKKGNFLVKAVGVAAAVLVTGYLLSQRDSEDSDDGFPITLTLPPQ